MEIHIILLMKILLITLLLDINNIFQNKIENFEFLLYNELNYLHI